MSKVQTRLLRSNERKVIRIRTGISGLLPAIFFYDFRLSFDSESRKTNMTKVY